MEKIKKHKWFILSYILYVSIVHISIYKDRDYWNILLFFAIIVPIVVYMLYSLRIYYKNKKKKATDICFDEETTNKTSDIYKPCAFSEAWTFMSFVKKFGPKIGFVSHMNSRTKDIFHTCEISDSDGKTISVRFDPSLGELTSNQLKERKMELWVGKRKDNNRYYLYDKTYKEWTDVDL